MDQRLPSPDVLLELRLRTQRDRRTIMRFFTGGPMHAATRLQIRRELESINRAAARQRRLVTSPAAPEATEGAAA